jgi:hypothetical protein
MSLYCCQSECVGREIYTHFAFLMNYETASLEIELSPPEWKYTTELSQLSEEEG